MFLTQLYNQVSFQLDHSVNLEVTAGICTLHSWAKRPTPPKAKCHDQSGHRGLWGFAPIL